MLLTRQQIDECQDIPRETTHIPEWGGEVIVRGLTGTERDCIEEELYGEGSKAGQRIIRARYAVQCIVDEGGHRLFADDDVEKMGRKSARALERVFSVVKRLSGLTREDMEQLEKN